MRKLATVRRILEIKPIEGADHIELAIVDGWKCVVGKDQFSVGELIIYCEVDTVLPVHPDYEFLRKSCHVQADWLPNGEGFKLRTMKLRGQVSQGLVLRISAAYPSDKEWIPMEGEDVTDNLGIIKWDPPLPKELEGKAKGRYPSYIPKTYQERVQNIVRDVFAPAVVAHKLWEPTLKLDGESCTFYHKDGEVGTCSRTVDFIMDQDNAFVRMFHKCGMGMKLPEYGNIAIQGELMGPGIHGNRENLDTHAFYAFDVWDIDTQQYLSHYQRNAIITVLGLQIVPVLSARPSTLEELGCGTLEGMLKYVDRHSMNHKVAEGVVFKSVDGSKSNPLYSFKCINNRYLLGGK